MSTNLLCCASMCMQNCRAKFLTGGTIYSLLDDRNYYSTKTKSDYLIHYQALELGDNADQEEVRTSFLKLVKKYHPDSGSPEADVQKFQRIEYSYRKLQNKFAEDRWNTEKGVGEYGLYYEEKPKEFDIKHTAPQHRHYLSYDGLGYGNPQQRQKQYQKHRARTALDNVYNHRISKLTPQEPALVTRDKQEAKKIKLRSEMDRLVEDLIQESIARGDFDNLSGSGKPLRDQNTNPYVDFVTQKMNEVMINNGYVPEWITLQKEIQEDANKIREDLGKIRSRFGRVPLTEEEKKEWDNAVNDQQHAVCKLNKKINNFNLQVPLLEKQKVFFQLNLEAEKVLKCGINKFEVNQMNETVCNPKEQHHTQSSMLDIFDFIFTRPT